MEQAERERIVAEVAVHLREGTVPMTDSTTQNPVAGYIDRAHTRLERERVFASQQSVIAFGAQLRNAGDFVTDDLSGEPLFIVRGEDGVLRGFFNIRWRSGSCR